MRTRDAGQRIAVGLDVAVCTPLHMAIKRSDLRMLELLLDYASGNKQDVNEPTWNGSTPLQLACKYKRVKAAHVLLDAGASLTRPVETTVHLAGAQSTQRLG